MAGMPPSERLDPVRLGRIVAGFNLRGRR